MKLDSNMGQVKTEGFAVVAGWDVWMPRHDGTARNSDKIMQNVSHRTLAGME